MWSTSLRRSRPKPARKTRSPSGAQRLMQLEKAQTRSAMPTRFSAARARPAPALAGLMRRLMRKVDSGMAVFQPLIEALDQSA